MSPKAEVVGCRKVEGFGFALNGRRTRLLETAFSPDFVRLP